MKSRLAGALIRIASDLGELGVRWALVGGLAVSARAEPRTTRDVDVAVLTDSDAAAEALVFELRQRGYELSATVEQTKLKRFATARLYRPDGSRSGPVVDLLFYTSSIEFEIVEAAEHIEVLPGVVVPVARVPHLLAMKVLARDDRTRPQDWDDLMALLAVASSSDIELAKELLRTIESRGADRGRALSSSFEQLLLER